MNPEIAVRNVLVTASTGRPINLAHVRDIIPEAQYDPSSFPGVRIRVSNPKSTVLIFRSGKMVCAGSESAADAEKAVNGVARYLRSNGIAVNDPIVTIQNVVATADIGVDLSVDAVAKSLPRTMYEPEIFPAAMHRMQDPKTTLLIFNSGKMVCAGAKSVADAETAIGRVCEALRAGGLLDGADRCRAAA